MSNCNIFEHFTACLIDVFKVSYELIRNAMYVEVKFDIEDFFEKVELKNKQDIYPTLVKKYESSKGYTYLLSCPLGLGISDFENYKEAIEIQLRYKVEIRERNGYVEIEVITKELPTTIDYVLPTREKDSIYIPFASSIEGEVYLDLKETPHTLCTGTTGGGKSITTKNIITSIINLYPNEVNLHLIDFKVVELSAFKNLKMTKCYATEIEEAKEVIADLMSECKRRYKLFEEVGVTNIYDYNKKVSHDKRLKLDFIVIEEFVMLLQDKKKIAMSTLKTLASLSRASGQFLYITAQRFDNTVIDLVLRSVIGNRICHLVESENDSRLILDDIGAEKLRGNGHIIFKQGRHKVECQGYFITDSQIKNYTRKYFLSKYARNHLNAPKSVPTVSTDKILDNEKENETRANTEAQTITDLSFLDNI